MIDLESNYGLIGGEVTHFGSFPGQHRRGASRGYEHECTTYGMFGYSIDVLVRPRSAVGSTEWVVEVDGPFHFLRDGRTPRGDTRLKRKQLRQLSYGRGTPVCFDTDEII